MKGGRPGTTDWSRINVAPLPESHDEDFARLAVAVARRYPEVHYFQVWSELKGYWDTAANRWDVEGYTRLYNDVYRALKAAEPSVEVGGPYAAMVTWGDPSAGGFPSALTGAWGTVDQRSLDVVTYWLAHADGAQFLAVDGSLDPHDGQAPADPGAATALFGTLDRWLRERTDLPIWWSEWYVGMPGVRSRPRVWLAVATAALVQLTTSGARRRPLVGPRALSRQPQPGPVDLHRRGRRRPADRPRRRAHRSDRELRPGADGHGRGPGRVPGAGHRPPPLGRQRPIPGNHRRRCAPGTVAGDGRGLSDAPPRAHAASIVAGTPPGRHVAPRGAYVGSRRGPSGVRTSRPTADGCGTSRRRRCPTG